MTEPMTHEEAVRFARHYACLYKSEHSYLPQTKEELMTWMPHEWVVAIIRDLSRFGPSDSSGPSNSGGPTYDHNSS